MKIAMVVQRYGQEVIGGAESYCRQLAEVLSKQPDTSVDIYTTTALDERTWANVLSPGTTVDHGVRVHRFHSKIGRRRYLAGLVLRAFSLFWAILRELGVSQNVLMAKPILWIERLFYVLQGPYCPELVKALRADQDKYDMLCFVTYLFYPAIAGADVLSGKTLLIPTAHDERAFYLASTARLFKQVQSIGALSKPEADLICSVYPSVSSKVKVLGYGVDLPPVFPEISSELKKQLPLKDYLLFLGRISPGKGVESLIEMVETYRAKTGHDLVLLLAGAVQNLQLPKCQHVIYLGKVSEADKWALIKSAFAVVNPSALESLSILVIESIAVGVPVLVNVESPVLLGYTRRFNTVLGYETTDEFIEAVGAVRLRRSGAQASDFKLQLENSEQKARDEYSWAHVTQRILT